MSVGVKMNPGSLMQGQDERGRPLYSCCLCFHMFYGWQLAEENGKPVDVCKECMALEKEFAEHDRQV